ncbi:unnamed protein product [Peronospora farinosa]|uniref:subtilisin n=1 Tax=Peronospora farinosa TaxID=134698 RepID=A0AAV0U7S9_9STRA|nr:unnamed protein product [Peronospora farinosa]CAI5732866.1 unnamed protein product [Peronospora farinosa]
MRDGTASALQEADVFLASQSNSVPRDIRIAQVVDSLRNVAAKAQQPLKALLDQKTRTTKTFSSSTTLWISNQMYITDATIELLQQLKVESSIAEIHEQFVLTMGDHFHAEHLDANAESGTNIQTWSVEKIGAEAVWAQGFMGLNVTIATIDTGARATHEVLRSNFRGDYGWFDPETKSATPFDLSGHGTHVLGSIVGTTGIGVAPRAEWIACRGCRSFTSCLESSLLACAQFVLCPTDPKGINANCSKAPRIVNNSWGISRGTANFSAVIAAWQAAGIIPIFSIGNGGSLKMCRTLYSPGSENNVIGVGATDSGDFLFPRSSTGPSLESRIKPDIVAPGVGIYSAWWTRDNVYAITSGTSMASPHVAGAVALLLSAKPGLTYSQVWATLTTSTVRDESIVHNASFYLSCGNTSASTFPNNIFGYGRLDVWHAMEVILSSKDAHE